MNRFLLALVVCATVAAGGTVSGEVVSGPPSILPQCMDPDARVGVGPSARARECTRQYCARPEYQAKVTAYATSRPQDKASAAEALTCITRAEQDRGAN
jgi:hypothetical protein